jgi:hypothetical protein
MNRNDQNYMDLIESRKSLEDDNDDDMQDNNDDGGPFEDSQVSEDLTSTSNDQDSENQLQGDNQVLRGKWTLQEDELLKNAVQEFGGKNWRKISSRIEGRTDVQCLHRWQKVLRPGLVKGPWTKEVIFILSFLTNFEIF